MTDKTPRTKPNARVISSKLPDRGAQIVIDESIALATQDGSGLILDSNVIELQSDRIKLSAGEFVEIQGTPLNTQLVQSEINSKEFADITRMNRFAGEMLIGFNVKHTHLFPSIYVPSTYKSNILHQLKIAAETVATLAEMAASLDLDSEE